MAKSLVWMLFRECALMLFVMCATPTRVSGRRVNIYMSQDPFAPTGNLASTYAPTFEQYLDRVVGSAHNLTFKLFNLGALHLDSLGSNIDFYYGSPSIMACCEATFMAKAILTLKRPLPGGESSDKYGGAIVARATDSSINTLEDIKGKVVGIEFPQGWASSVVQQNLLMQNGFSIFRDAKKVISGNQAVHYDQQRMLDDIHSGVLDVGFVRADLMYRTASYELMSERFKIIGNRNETHTVSGQSPTVYPFPVSTPLFPEWGLVAFPWVEQWLVSEVTDALLKINSSSSEAKKGIYDSWEPALQYSRVFQSLEDNDLIVVNQKTGQRYCQWDLSGYHVYDSPACPSGSYKVSESEASDRCKVLNSSCPLGLQCWCGTCKRATEYNVSMLQGLVTTEAALNPAASCSKMQVCLELVQGASFQVAVRDNMLRNGSRTTYVLRKLEQHAPAPKAGKFEGGRFGQAWEYVRDNITLFSVGLYSLELLVNDVQLDESPFLVNVLATPCPDSKIADGQGSCACPGGTVTIGGSCVLIMTIVVSIVFPCFALLAAFLVWRSCKPEGLDERRIRSTIVNLRKQLKIRREDGFVLLGCERPPSTRNIVGFISKSSAEAAARMALWEDFDVNQFDAFCVNIKGGYYSTSDVGGGRAGDSVQVQLLHDWILQTSKELLDPQQDQSHIRFIHDSQTKFGRVPKLAPFPLSSSENFHPHRAIPSTRPTDRSSKEWTSLNIPRDFHIEVCNESLGDMHRLTSCTSEDKFKYFQEQVMRCRIWKDENERLFGMLKNVVQVLMNRVAKKCDERYELLELEPGGAELFSYESLGLRLCPTIDDSLVLKPSDASVSHAIGDSSSISHAIGVSRQDHPKVAAILVNRSDEVAAMLFRSRGPAAGCTDTPCTPVGQEPTFKSNANYIVNEEVFLTQLDVRTTLLNDAFQKMISQVDQVQTSDSSGSESLEIQSFACSFADGESEVVVYPAPPKKLSRMREKLFKYAPPHPKSQWPLAANILDPVRTSVVCNGPSQVLAVHQWFLEDASNSLPVIRIKNKFARSTAAVDGYRDLSLSVVFTHPSGLRIIGEVQIHDRIMHDLKLQMHKLYKVKRAADASSVSA